MSVQWAVFYTLLHILSGTDAGFIFTVIRRSCIKKIEGTSLLWEALWNCGLGQNALAPPPLDGPAFKSSHIEFFELACGF
jgi:hypothetical protein